MYSSNSLDVVKQCHNHVVYLYDKKQKYSLNITLLQKITYFCLITFTNLLGMLLIIVYLKERTFLFLGGQSSSMPWLFYTACIGMHFLADELDNVIQFGTLSRVSGFLCHGSKWAHRFVHFLQYTSGLEVLACSIYTDFNYVITMLPPLSPGS